MKSINSLLKPFDNKLESPFIMNPSRFASGGWDVDDDFESYANDAAFATAYPTTDADDFHGDASANNINIAFDYNQTNQQTLLYKDLMGATIDNTAWVLRNSFNPSTITRANGIYQWGMWVGISSTTGASGAAQDYLGFGMWSLGSTSETYYTQKTDGSAPNSPYGTAFATTADTTLRYVEQIRTSSTTVTCEIFSDSAYSSSVEAETPTIASTIQDLRYWKVHDYDNAITGQFNGTIAAPLRFADGVTEAP